MLGFDNDTSEQAGQDEADGEFADLSERKRTENHCDSAKSRKRYFALIDYLTREGIPDDFMIIR